MNRRKFSRHFGRTLVTFAFLEQVFSSGALASHRVTEASHWAIRLEEYSMDLKKSGISPAEWQKLTEELFSQVPLADLLRFIDFERLARGFEFPDLGVKTSMVKFPPLKGLPGKTTYVKKIFGMSADRAIIPHGHSNMASAHLVLDGKLHLRQYDKLGTDKNMVTVRPTVDEIVVPGAVSSISDDKNNIHWMIARTPQAFTFDVIMLDLQGKAYDIHNLDMDNSEKQGDGTLRVPEIPVNLALKQYGKDHH